MSTVAGEHGDGAGGPGGVVGAAVEGTADVDRFRAFFALGEPRLRRALVAAYGPELGAEATADALTWACVVRVDGGERVAAAPVAVAAPDGPALHPHVRVTPAGPYAPGDRVRVEGAGFQPDADGFAGGVAWCPAGAADVTACGGGPDLGEFGVGADGAFLVDSFALPDGDARLDGTRCASAPGACELTWYLADAGPLPPDGIALDLSG